MTTLVYFESVNFDNIAPWYHLAEKLSFGHQLQDVRTSLLAEAVEGLDGSARILLIGDGDGRFCQELVKNTKAEIDYLELSEGMLHEARARLNSTQVKFHHTDFIAWETSDYDLLVSHFVLDCYDHEELDLFIKNASQILKANGKWLISDFDPDIAWWAKVWVMLMYFFFKCVAQLPTKQLKRPDNLLEQNHFSKYCEFQKMNRFLYSSLWVKKQVG